MEFLFIDRASDIDWAVARQINSKSDICIALNRLKEYIDSAKVEKGFDEQVVHSGLRFYSDDAFKPISLAAMNWFFLRPPKISASNSWMASLHVIVLKKGILDHVAVDLGYKNCHLTAADIAFQILRRGGIVKYDPVLLLKNNNMMPEPDEVVHRNDLRRFVIRFFGKRAALSAFPLDVSSIVFENDVPQVIPRKLEGVEIRKSETRGRISKYAAVIPTINRYTYLKKAIRSLLDNPRPPAEIIVVDQTPSGSRIPDYYDEFDKALVKVYFLEKAGQCSSRNYAIQQTTCDWILFFDDDSEAWKDMISSHIDLLENSEADVSTGVSLAPWKDRTFINDSINFFHVASVLDTGNCMMKRSLVQDVGLFDLAFDKGSGADDNLGKRLFLSGALIIFNPKAIRTHHKAPMGGLREHGAWWKNKGTYLGPFPLPTESYDFITFYPSHNYVRLCLYRLFTSYRRSGFWMNMINTVFFPWKILVSYRRGRKLFLNNLR